MVGDMNDERWKKLMEDDSIELTRDEISQGWHWCNEFDGLLVGPGMSEMEFCKCEPLKA